MGRLLFDKEQVLLLNRDLAVLLKDDREALFLQQLHYWLEKNEAKDRNFYDGRYWCYNSLPAWIETNFPFWSLKVLKRVVSSLRAKGLVLTANYNKMKADQTLWYSIDYKKLDDLGSIEPIGTKGTDGKDKRDRPIPENNSREVFEKAKPEKYVKESFVKLGNKLCLIMSKPSEQGDDVECMESAESLRNFADMIDEHKALFGQPVGEDYDPYKDVDLETGEVLECGAS